LQLPLDYVSKFSEQLSTVSFFWDPGEDRGASNAGMMTLTFDSLQARLNNGTGPSDAAVRGRATQHCGDQGQAINVMKWQLSLMLAGGAY